MRSYLRANPPASEAPRWGQRFFFGVGLSGLIWGLAGVLPFREPSLIHEVFLTFVLAGLSAGAMSTLSSFRGAYVAFLAPAVLPFAIRVFLQLGEVFGAMGAMLLLFIAAMSAISFRFCTSVVQSLRLRYENLDLMRDLAAAERILLS